MAGVALSELVMLAGSQYPAWINDPYKLRNLMDTRIFTMSRMSSGKPKKKKIQAGTSVSARLLFDYINTTRFVNPGEQFTHTNQQTGTSWDIPWAYRQAEMAYLAQEVKHVGDHMGEDYRTLMIADVLEQKYQVVWSGIQEHTQAHLYSVPNWNLMENATPSGGQARNFQSLFCFNNELNAGTSTAMLFQTYLTGNGGNEQTKGLSRETHPKWRCQTGTYDFQGPTAGTPNTKGLFPALSNILKKGRWDPLPMTPEYSDKRTTPQAIQTQRMGVVNYEFALFDNQDIFRGMGKMSGSDPAYPGPTFNGIPVEWVDALDTVAAYPTGSGGALSTYDDTAGATNAGPRYHLWDFNVIHYINHESYAWSTEGPEKLQGYTGPTYGQTYDCWEQLICEDMRRNGTLYPNADITNATTA